MDYLNNIKNLIENDIVLKKKHRLIETNTTLNTYFEIGRLIVEAQGGKERLEYKDDIKLISDETKISIKDMIKNPIIIKTNKEIDKLSEKALKMFILEKIEEFLLELGYVFAFIGSEYKLDKYKCDLLFFNIELNSYVVIELKIRKLKPSDIGQIKFYMNYIDSNIKKDYMNKTIGIILCKEGNEIIVKYVTDEKIFFSFYELK